MGGQDPTEDQQDVGPALVPIPHHHSLTSWSSAEGAGALSSEVNMQTGYTHASLAMVILR